MLIFALTGWNWIKNQRWTNNALRKAFGGLSIGVSGSVSTGDIAAGSITPALTSPGAYWYGGTAAYSAKNYTAALSPVLSAVANGVRISFKAGAECEDGPITITVNGLGPKKIQLTNGINLVQGDIRINQVVELTYNASLDGATGAWEMTSVPANPQVFAGTAQAGSTGTAHVVTSSIPAKSFAALAGRRIQYRVTVENTGALTLALDGLAAKPIRKDDAQPLKAGDVKIGEVLDLIWSATDDVFLLKGARGSVFVGTDAGATDAYAVTIASFPAAWVTGVVVAFRANTSNTGPATLNVTPAGGSAVGAIALKKFGTKDLDTNDILAGQWVTTIFDGTNLQVQSCGDMISSAEQSLLGAAGVINVAHGLGVKPRRVRWVAVAQGTTDHSFVTGDEVDVFAFANTSNENRSLVPCMDSTNVSLIQGCAATSVTILSKATPDVTNYTAITSANWKVKAYYAP